MTERSKASNNTLRCVASLSVSEKFHFAPSLLITKSERDRCDGVLMLLMEHGCGMNNVEGSDGRQQNCGCLLHAWLNELSCVRGTG